MVETSKEFMMCPHPLYLEASLDKGVSSIFIVQSNVVLCLFHDRNVDNKINRIQERALRIAYKDNTSPYEKLLENDNSVSIHQKNLQLLMVEIYKTRNHLNPSFMMEIFEEKAMPYQLRSLSNLNLPNVRTTCYGTDTARFMGQRILAKLPIEVKTSVSLTVFKKLLLQLQDLQNFYIWFRFFVIIMYFFCIHLL